MEDNTLIKVVAICCLTAVLIVNSLTMKIDSVLTGTVCAIIGGLAGYTIGREQVTSKIVS